MQATQNSAAAQSLSNKVRLMVTHLGSGTRGLILEKVWVKSGSADSADGKEKVSAIVIFFYSCFLIVSGLVSQVSNGASHTRRGWTGGRNQGNGVSRANHWSHQFDPKYLQRLGEPCASGYARNHTRHTAPPPVRLFDFVVSSFASQFMSWFAVLVLMQSRKFHRLSRRTRFVSLFSTTVTALISGCYVPRSTLMKSKTLNLRTLKQRVSDLKLNRLLMFHLTHPQSDDTWIHPSRRMPIPFFLALFRFCFIQETLDREKSLFTR